MLLDTNRFTEHSRIDQYLKRRSMQIQQFKKIINHENKLSNFPIGLIVTTKDEENNDTIEFINHYACELFHLKENATIDTLKEKLDEYVKLKNNTPKSETLKDLIFNYPSFTFEIENFFPFQCKHSKSTILYIKINDIENEKYIVIDKYDKYLEEQKYIEFNLIKNINYQYLHTLYHELNNPLNALLAISGDKKKFDSTEIGNIGNSKIYPKNQNPMMNRRKTNRTNTRKILKKEINKQTVLSNIEKNKLLQYEIKFKRKSLNGDNPTDIGGRINLLVKIIKIFIKNFILYLKTRADNLLTLKNEFNLQNEASDIMNAVEVSEYEKDLTKHKNVKLNLEYILDLYLQKYHCLFKYKEIEYDTNFSELKNMYVITDDFNFSYYIRQIYTYLYYVVPKKEGFSFVYNKVEKNKIKITIKKKVNGNSSKMTDNPSEFAVSQMIQTKEMTKEVLYAMTKKLNFAIEIFDNEINNKINVPNNNNKNSEQINNYLSITIPFIKKDKSTEIDEFRDDEINEKIGKNTLLLEEKLRRHLPRFNDDERRNSNVSTIHIVDVMSRNGEDKKDNTDSFISFPKNINFRNENSLTNNNNNLNNDFQKNKFRSFKSTPSNDSFLSKCLKKSDNKKSEKEKSKFRKESGLNINLIKNKINNHSSNKNIFINITNINNSPNKINKKFAKTKSFASLKNIINKKSEKILLKSKKSQKLNGIFSLINKLGYEENTSEMSHHIDKLKKCQITFKEQSPNRSLLSKPKKASIDNLSKFTLNKRESGHNSISLTSAFFRKRNPSKSNYRSSCFISDIGDRGGGFENEEKNKNNVNINKNNIIINNSAKNGVHIEFIKKEKMNMINNTENSKYSKGKSNKNLKLSEIEEEGGQKRNSHKITPLKSNKDCMTFFSDKNKNKNKIALSGNNTLIDDYFNDNKNLFLEANKERNLYMQKFEEKDNNINFNSQSNIEQNSEDYEEEEEGEEFEDYEESNVAPQCKCADLLVVDDEEFNVMASQRMLKNLGYESDKAYNGEECINLIKEKKENKCNCGKNYYRIIFLDIVMPVMDGIKAAKTIQEMIDNKEINENTKIVFISGNIDGADLQKSLLEINCVKECLQKPVQITKYEKLLEKYYNN